jgi:peptidoglycan/LPS O-acetylase OafA/YrhL
LTPPAKPGSRLAYIDNVRIFLSMLVVAHHAGQPYGSDGWWLFQSPLRSGWIGLFFGVNEAFFMGLFFLMAGYFPPAAWTARVRPLCAGPPVALRRARLHHGP